MNLPLFYFLASHHVVQSRTQMEVELFLDLITLFPSSVQMAYDNILSQFISVVCSPPKNHVATRHKTARRWCVLSFPLSIVQNFELNGVMEHKVQSDIQFKLLVTQDGRPVDCNLPVRAWLKGLRDTAEVCSATTTYIPSGQGYQKNWRGAT